MQLDKLSDDWLFQRHSSQTIRSWLRELRYFYFIRAWGGHANDGDTFQVNFGYTNREDLLEKLGQVGLTLNIIPDDFLRPVIGTPYPAEEFDKFKSEIERFKDLEQPGHSNLFGSNVFVWAYESWFEISVSGTKDNDLYEVTEDDFQVCLKLEKKFDTLNWLKFIHRNIEESVCCISKNKYPELYA